MAGLRFLFRLNFIKMKCIAVDDEPLALALLQDNIRQVPGLELVASCSTAMEALADIECSRKWI